MDQYKNRPMAIALTFFCVVMMALVTWAWAPASTQAAPPNQTVPIPTSTPEIDAPEATSTPTPDDGDDDFVDDGTDDEFTDEAPLGGGSGAELALPADAVAVVSEVGATEASVYAGPGTNFTLLGTLPAETPVELIGRNAGMAWYVVCCLPDGRAGWVAAAQLADAPLAEVISLPVLSDWRGLEPLTASPTPLAEEAELNVLVSHSPRILRAGDAVTLQFEVENLSAETAVDVRLRAELDSALSFLAGQATGGEFVEPATQDASAIVVAEWPAIMPGTIRIATVTVRLDEDLPPGAVVEQLVAVDAANASAQTVQSLIGLPPAMMPNFR